MRQSIVVVVLLGALESAAFAQETPLRQVHLGVDAGIGYSDQTGVEFDNVYSLGVTVPLLERWYIDSALSWWSYSQGFLPGCEPPTPCILGPGGPEGGLLIAGSVDSETLGLDLFPLYGIPTEGRWNPYVGFGARLEYVDYETSFLTAGNSDSWQALSPGIALGFTVPFAEHLAFQLDGRYYPEYWTDGDTNDAFVREVESRRSDTAVRVGLGWRF